MLAVLSVFLFVGCNRGRLLDEKGSFDVVYERIHGQGATTDYLHVSTSFEMLDTLPAHTGRSRVLSWIYVVHPNVKKEFLQQLAASMRRNGIDRIAKRSTTVQDVSTYTLRIRGPGLDIDLAFYDLRPANGKADPLWTDQEFTAVRRFISDVQLMAELYGIRRPERVDIEEPNQALQRNASTGSVSNFESPARRGRPEIIKQKDL